MNWEYELTYPPRRGYVRVATSVAGRTFTRYTADSLGDTLVALDAFHYPITTYYWEDGALALLPSAEQYAIHKRANAPTE